MKKSLISLLFFILPLFLFGSEIAIFHTSDTHGFYYPRKTESGKTIGGFALIKGYIDTYKGPYLLLDSGDFTSGSLEAKESKGNSSVNIMNQMGYAATTIGNHEGDFGKEILLKNIKNLQFDVLAANIYDPKDFEKELTQALEEQLQTKKQTNKKMNLEFLSATNNTMHSSMDNVKPYNVYKVGGKKIAVIGIAKKLSKKTKNEITVTDGSKEIEKAVKELQNIPHDATILLIHNSINDTKHENQISTKKMIKGLEKDIDLVLGGHAHIVLQEKYKGIQYVESGSKAEGLSEVILTFDDKTGKLTDIRAKYVELDITKFPSNTNIEKVSEENRLEGVDEVIGKTIENIKVKNNNKNELDSPLGNLFTDIIKETAPQADFALHNTGGVKLDILEGNITKRVVINAFPFPNKIMLVKVNGAFINNFIKETLREDKTLFQYSKEVKIEYRWKNKNPELVKVKINGQDLEEDKRYLIAVNDFIAKGNEEGYLFKEIESKVLLGDKDLGDIFTNYVKAHPQGIKAPATGRIKKVK